jgi:hypothetical protein
LGLTALERAAYDRFKNFSVRRASFIGSSNNTNILTDSTGNRRFLVFRVSNIESREEYEIPYEQLYAQVYRIALDKSFRHWFDKDEMTLINEHNRRFEIRSMEEELLLSVFRKPNPNEPYQRMTSSQITGILQGYAGGRLSNVKVGRALAQLGFDKSLTMGRTIWNVVRKNEAELQKERDVQPKDTSPTQGLIF